MSMHDDPDLSGKIWEGEFGAVAEARKRYEADTERQLVPWVSTLYSFRNREECREELKPILEPLAGRLWRSGDREFDRFTADELDVLSTVFLWAADAFRPSPREISHFTFEAVDVAEVMAHLGRKRSRAVPDGGHTYELLTLTYAAIQIRRRFISDAYSALAEVRARVAAIRDPNQRARVYRKLGALYLRLKDPIGFWFLYRALTVPGIARGTREKTLRFWKQ